MEDFFNKTIELSEKVKTMKYRFEHLEEHTWKMHESFEKNFIDLEYKVSKIFKIISLLFSLMIILSFIVFLLLVNKTQIEIPLYFPDLTVNVPIFGGIIEMTAIVTAMAAVLSLLVAFIALIYQVKKYNHEIRESKEQFRVVRELAKKKPS